jgi:hypothetical protein
MAFMPKNNGFMSPAINSNEQLSADLLNFSSEIALNRKIRENGNESKNSIERHKKSSVTMASNNSAFRTAARYSSRRKLPPRQQATTKKARLQSAKMIQTSRI